MNQTAMPLSVAVKLPGIADLKPLPVKGFFARAYMAEVSGQPDVAAEYLDKAIAAEAVANA
jgi:hypothetical protein